MIRALCNNWPSFFMGFIFECLQMFDFSAKQPSGQEQDGPSTGMCRWWHFFHILASKHDTLSGNNVLSSWLLMAWLLAEWAVNACTIFYSINSCYTCVGQGTQMLNVEQIQKTTTVKSCLGHLYKHTAPSRELCIFKTSASSSQPASLTFSGPINATTTSLIPKVQVHGFDFLFSAHLLCAGAIIYQ